METVLRAIAIYLFLLLVFRISGKRTLSQMHPFDMVLLLIIGDSVSQGLMGDDFSITTALLLVTTLVLMELLMAFIKQKSKVADRWLDDVPMIVVEDGKPLPDRMKRARVDASEVLEAARILHGLENMQQVKYAVLERDGSISVIPKKD
ncbi:YetF domain-containing protein [Lysobacter sp. F60174L2]|uniref:YetF domain-containing protein n=1 Tax=Lysobacter sp. F60174L2 TaxID=3459295 RepID=UPI00403E1236